MGAYTWIRPPIRALPKSSDYSKAVPAVDSHWTLVARLEAARQVLVLQAALRPEAEVERVDHQEVLDRQRSAVEEVQRCARVATCVASETAVLEGVPSRVLTCAPFMTSKHQVQPQRASQRASFAPSAVKTVHSGDGDHDAADFFPQPCDSLDVPMPGNASTCSLSFTETLPESKPAVVMVRSSLSPMPAATLLTAAQRHGAVPDAM